jgi:hypothetical protein
LPGYRKVLVEPAQKKECKDGGMRFDFDEKALEFSNGYK